MQEIGRGIPAITEDKRDTTFLFQRLSVCMGRCGLILCHLFARLIPIAVIYTFLLAVSVQLCASWH